MSDHARYHDDIGAYLLGALNDLERQAFERHLAGCDECQEEVVRLRPAAEALPASVVQLEPPPGLKKRLMAEVEGDARRAQPRRRFAIPRVPRLAFAAAALVLGLAIGFGVAQLGGEEGTRTVGVTVAKAMPQAGGTLAIGDDRATLELHDMPDLGRGRVYQVWYQRGERLVPTRTFEVGRSGMRRVELPAVGDAKGVFVTREPQGGAQVPSEDPIVRVSL